MVNNWIEQSDNRMLLFVLVLVLFNVISFFTNGDALLQMVEPLLFLPILIFFFYKYSKIRLVLIAFLLFAILGDLSSLFDMKAYGVEVDAVAYCLGYLCLIYEAINRIKKLNISVLVGVYLVVVFIINTYFLYIFYGVLRETISNSVELTLIVVRVVSLLLFSLFSFTVYLSVESRQSILLLLMSISLVFSDVLYLVTDYYMYYWIFDFISKSLYLVAFYCFYLYVVNHKKYSISKTKLNKALI